MAGQGGETEHPFLDSLIEVCKILGSQGKDVVEIITGENVLKKEKLKPFVDQYLKSTDKTLKFFKSVEKCVAKAKISHRRIQVAIEQLETESLAGDSHSWLKSAFTAVVQFSLDKKNKYVETLEKLKKVKAMEDPFGDELTTQCKSVLEEQVMLLVKIGEVQVMLEKKLKNAKIWRAVGITILVASLIVRIALAAASLHHHGGHTFGVDMTHSHALLTASGILTKKLTRMLTDYEKGLKARKDLSELTGNSTEVNIKEIETIKGLVDALITKMSSILEAEEVAMEKREEQAVKLLMQDIILKVKRFAEKLEEVGENVAESSESVASGRDLVLKHIDN